MNCPLEIPENKQVLLDYVSNGGARKLDAQCAGMLESHMEACPSCREFAAGQRALWEALDGWEAAPVSADFDSRLFRRVEQEMSFWDILVRPFRTLMVRPSMARRGLPVAAAACLLVVAGVLIEQPVSSPAPQKDLARVESVQVESAQVESVQFESVQPEQVEQALDAMEMLSEFSHHVRGDGRESKL